MSLLLALRMMKTGRISESVFWKKIDLEKLASVNCWLYTTSPLSSLMMRENFSAVGLLNSTLKMMLLSLVPWYLTETWSSVREVFLLLLISPPLAFPVMGLLRRTTAVNATAIVFTTLVFILL